MAGLNYVLSVNPAVRVYAPKEGFGIYGSSLPSSFYRKDETLGMWVPSRMTERYTAENETTTTVATYADFKRFQTSVKIK